jgi:hypothetical protein
MISHYRYLGNEFSIISSNNLQISRTSRHLTFLDPHSFLFFSFFQALPVFLEKLDRVRTIFFPTSLERPSCMTGIEKFLSKWKLLWALEMDDCGLEVLPKMIGTQKQLRCICLHSLTKSKRLPEATFKLQNLHSDSAWSIGRDARYMISLRFLCLSTTQKPLPEGGIRCVGFLQNIFIVECENLEYLREDMQGLKSLQKLHIL